jgi:hypothetical protein
VAKSDCVKCWNTPCSCGYDYIHNDMKQIDELIEVLQWVKATREANPFRVAQRDLTDEERVVFRNQYPDVKRIPFSLNQLNQEQLNFIASLNALPLPLIHCYAAKDFHDEKVVLSEIQPRIESVRLALNIPRRTRPQDIGIRRTGTDLRYGRNEEVWEVRVNAMGMVGWITGQLIDHPCRGPREDLHDKHAS